MLSLLLIHLGDLVLSIIFFYYGCRLLINSNYRLPSIVSLQEYIFPSLARPGSFLLLPVPPPSLGFPSVMYQGSLVYSTPPAPLRSLPLPVLCSQSLSHQLELTFFMLLNYLIFYYMFLQILIFIFLHTCFLFHF